MEQKYKDLSFFDFGGRNKNKKRVLVCIEKKGKGVSRRYARVIPRSDPVSLGGFMEDHIDLGARVTNRQDTGRWKRIPELQTDTFGKKRKQFSEPAQDCLDDYCYRFNRSIIKEGIFDNPMLRMVNTAPCLNREQFRRAIMEWSGMDGSENEHGSFLY